MAATGALRAHSLGQKCRPHTLGAAPEDCCARPAQTSPPPQQQQQKKKKKKRLPLPTAPQTTRQATSPVTLAPGASWAATTAMAFTSDPLEDFCAGNPEEPECLVYDD